jgi:hypothetical protein
MKWFIAELLLYIPESKHLGTYFIPYLLDLISVLSLEIGYVFANVMSALVATVS